MPRPILATIHTAALAHNLGVARAAAPDAKVWAVVKANAYGHGIERVFDALRSADGFALLDLAEAQRLRALDWRGPILLLEGCFDARDLELYSGMNRLGFPPERYRAAWTRLNALPQVEEITLMTHFSDADGPKGISAALQAFDAVTHDLPGERTLSNSAATLRHRDVLAGRSDWVRPGILVYGSAPDFPEHTAAGWGLQPTMTLSSKIIGVQDLKAGDTVGYGSSFTADGPLRIGVVACGYADGYPRHCSTGTPVLVNGVRTRMVGRVSMDMITVDLTPVPAAGMGSEVTLWGRAGGGAELPIDEVAQAGATVGYELMCALAQRVPVQVE
jgi:alanine racemase